MSVAEVLPGERGPVEAWLRERAVRGWGSGRTLACRDSGRVVGVARLVDPNPGDGHHREHVRELVLDVDAERTLPALARAAVALAGPRTRVEAWCPESDAGRVGALADAGLTLEARLPEAWREAGATCDLLAWGRPASPLRGAPPPAPPPRARRQPSAFTLRWLDAETGPALARFLATLVPGRAYRPGTLLSEAERLETQRAGATSAPWLLALDEEGEVAGGLVLERDSRPARAHVRRLHLDVAPRWRGRGLAAALVARALHDARGMGMVRLEADPRSGHAEVLAALARGGMSVAGRQVGAWRLRGPSGAWDEDVVLLSASTGPALQLSDGGRPSAPSPASGSSATSGTSSGVGSLA